MSVPAAVATAPARQLVRQRVGVVRHAGRQAFEDADKCRPVGLTRGEIAQRHNESTLPALKKPKAVALTSGCVRPRTG